MPVLPPAPGAIRWEAHYHLGDDINVVNVMHLQTAILTGLSLPQLVAVAGVAVPNWDTQLFAGLSSDATMSHHVFTDLSTPTGPQTVVTDTTAGGVVSPSAPASSCLLVQMRSATRSKSDRGRVFLCGVAKADIVTPQTWDAGTVESFEDAFQAIDLALTGGSPASNFAVVSYFGPPTVKAGAIAPGNPKRAHSTLRATAQVNGPVSFTGVVRIASQRRRNA